MKNHKENLICVAEIGAPFGVHGEAHLRSFLEDTKLLASISEFTTERNQTLKLTIRQQKNGDLLAKIEGYPQREDVKKLSRVKLYAPRAILPQLKNSYYFEDLKGLEVRAPNGKKLGNVQAVHNFGAGDILDVKFENGAEEMLPFTKEFVPEISIEKGYLILHLPEFTTSPETQNLTPET